MAGYAWTYASPFPAKVALANDEDFCCVTTLVGSFAVVRAAQMAIGRRYAARLKTPYRPRLLWPWLLVIATATRIMLHYEVPLRIGFRLSRPALERLAEEALADPANSSDLAGRWAGVYQIAGVEIIGKTVVLYVGRDRGMYAFARVPGAAADVIFNVPELEDSPHFYGNFPIHEGLHDPQGERIDGDWFVMYSAYWRVKVGWS
jgi:hypothetical protein